MTLLTRLLKQAGRLNWILCASILSGTFATLLQLGILALGFDSLTHSTSATVWLTLGVFALVGGFLRFGEQYLGHLVAFKLLARFRDLTYDKLMTLAPAKLDTHRSSDMLKVVAQDIEQIEIFYAHTLSPIVIALVVSTVQCLLLAVVSPMLGLVAALAYVVVGVALPVFNAHQIKAASAELNAADTRSQRLAAETVTGKFELQQYQAVDQRLDRIEKSTEAYWDLNRIKGIKQDRQTVLMRLVLVASLVAFALIALTLGAPLIAILLFPFSFSRVLALASLPGTLSGGLLAARNLFSFWDEQPLVDDSGTATLEKVGTVGLEAVDFAYPSRPDDEILNGASLRLQAGERVGLIGTSGTGKSTIVKLIMRWYAAEHGKLALDDVDATTLTLESTRAPMNYVPQNAVIFAGSIRDNLTLRDNAAFSDDQLWRVLDAVHLSDTLRAMPEQLDTQISSVARRLSAGETQRLELARALLHDSELLILDEPTSNLDVVNEAIILHAVKRYYHGTVVIVTHRESSLAICDRVLKLEGGRLVER